MNRARNCHEFREAGRPWLCPTFNLVFADLQGNIGFQSVGRIPLRKITERGYRPGWDPQHQWSGLLSYDEMPGLINPKRGYVVTANNRLAPSDYPHPLAGCWASGHRARRLRQQIESKKVWSREDTRRLQLDVFSGRASLGVSPLITALEGDADPHVQQAVSLLRGWNYLHQRRLRRPPPPFQCLLHAVVQNGVPRTHAGGRGELRRAERGRHRFALAGARPGRLVSARSHTEAMRGNLPAARCWTN